MVGVRFRDDSGKNRWPTPAMSPTARGTAAIWRRPSGSVSIRASSRTSPLRLLRERQSGSRRRTAATSCAAFKSGWFWYIPLSDTLTSVGAVVAKEAAGPIRSGPEAALRAYIDECPIIKEHLDGATRVRRNIRRVSYPQGLLLLQHSVLGPRYCSDRRCRLLHRSGLLVRRAPGYLLRAACRTLDQHLPG